MHVLHAKAVINNVLSNASLRLVYQNDEAYGHHVETVGRLDDVEYFEPQRDVRECVFVKSFKGLLEDEVRILCQPLVRVLDLFEHCLHVVITSIAVTGRRLINEIVTKHK